MKKDVDGKRRFSLEILMVLVTGAVCTGKQRDEMFALLDFMTGKFTTPPDFVETMRRCRDTLLGQYPMLHAINHLVDTGDAYEIQRGQEKIFKNMYEFVKIDCLFIAPLTEEELSSP